jgi:hypothetical protein
MVSYAMQSIRFIRPFTNLRKNIAEGGDDDCGC